MNTTNSKSGFTLVELLVVIAIIGILAALLVPAISKSKSRVATAACVNNLRQLLTCWHLYSGDNDDALAPNNSVVVQPPIPPLLQGASWALADPTEENVRKGLLFGYNSSVGIYHCPADRSTLGSDGSGELPRTDDKAFNPVPGARGGAGTIRSRSYNMSLSVNGYPDFNPFIFSNVPMFVKSSQIYAPNTDKCLVFFDENEFTITDSQFGMPTEDFPGDPPTPNWWWNQPANRHNQGGTLSFADGHAERWKWKVEIIYTKWARPYLPEEERDWRRIKDCIKQRK